MNDEHSSNLAARPRPDKVNVLFIADAPSAAPKMPHRKMSEFMKAAKAAFTQVFGEFKDNEEFFKFYKEFGCYHDNVCLTPVKHLPPAEQKLERLRGVKPLAERIAALQPRLIVIVMKAIEPYAREAIKLAAAPSVENVASIPFPLGSMTNFNNSISGMANALRSVNW